MSEASVLLDSVERTHGGYERFLASRGNISFAAYDLAAARLACWQVTTKPVPSWREIRACMFDIVERIAWIDHVPNIRDVVRECEASGRPVMPAKPIY